MGSVIGYPSGLPLLEVPCPGKESERHKVKFDPTEVPAYKKGDRLVEKDVNVYTNNNRQNGEGPAGQVPFEQAMPQFQRAAEDAIDRELIPAAYRDLVRRYYEDLHRK